MRSLPKSLERRDESWISAIVGLTSTMFLPIFGNIVPYVLEGQLQSSYFMEYDKIYGKTVKTWACTTLKSLPPCHLLKVGLSTWCGYAVDFLTSRLIGSVLYFSLWRINSEYSTGFPQVCNLQMYYVFYDVQSQEPVCILICFDWIWRTSKHELLIMLADMREWVLRYCWLVSLSREVIGAALKSRLCKSVGYCQLPILKNRLQIRLECFGIIVFFWPGKELHYLFDLR